MDIKMEPLLEIKDLNISFWGDSGETKAVKGVSFHVNPGEIFGIIGESGSGKSVTVKSILHVNPENCKVTSGSILFLNQCISEQCERKLQKIRGKEISMVFQDSLSALNPVFTIGNKLVETIRLHQPMVKSEARNRALELLKAVGINEPENCMRCYPHQLSGGMRQRVLIAMAVSSNPKLLIADEPTTALDVTIQIQILRLLRDIQSRTGMSIIFITHDLGVVAQICSRIAVMCGGHIVEEGTAEEIFYHPFHPYTKALIDSIPKKGSDFAPYLERSFDETKEDGLCPFLERCGCCTESCKLAIPDIYRMSDTHYALCWKRG
jgi:oligopeptide transport system ATP-binding protein